MAVYTEAAYKANFWQLPLLGTWFLRQLSGSCRLIIGLFRDKIKNFQGEGEIPLCPLPSEKSLPIVTVLCALSINFQKQSMNLASSYHNLKICRKSLVNYKIFVNMINPLYGTEDHGLSHTWSKIT